MQIQNYETAFRRARKRFAHASRQVAEAATDRARARHIRRAMNARRLMAESQSWFEELALFDMESAS